MDWNLTPIWGMQGMGSIFLFFFTAVPTTHRREWYLRSLGLGGGSQSICEKRALFPASLTIIEIYITNFQNIKVEFSSKSV